MLTLPLPGGPCAAGHGAGGCRERVLGPGVVGEPCSRGGRSLKPSVEKGEQCLQAAN